MEAALAYAGPSRVTASDGQVALELSPNLLRDRTHLVARLAAPLPTRDALLALHDVARSELYVSPEEIRQRQLDPVVTVAPEEVHFEAFSLDESSYGRVSLRAAALADVEQRSWGTTNVEFSPALRLGLEGIRSSSQVALRVAASGLTLATEGRQVEEAKIELADSWVHGFLAVQAAIRRPAVLLELHPGDLRDVLTFLKGRRETTSPRSLRFQLTPGRAPSVRVEPWDEVLALGRSRHDAEEEREVRVWGRRRLLLLQRALPGARAARALLQGSGLPSFWTVDHGPVALTLGLSPWTERDWAGLEPFALPSGEGPPPALVERAALLLEERRRLREGQAAAALGTDEPAARAALEQLGREGRALYEPTDDAWLARRLFLGAPPPPAPSAERERAARAIVAKGGVAVAARRTLSDGAERREARVKGRGTYEVTAVLSPAGGLQRGVCACPFFARHGLEQGACKHLLALALSAST